jgi:hypothetical protein
MGAAAPPTGCTERSQACPSSASECPGAPRPVPPGEGVRVAPQDSTTRPCGSWIGERRAEGSTQRRRGVGEIVGIAALDGIAVVGPVVDAVMRGSSTPPDPDHRRSAAARRRGTCARFRPPRCGDLPPVPEGRTAASSRGARSYRTELPLAGGHLGLRRVGSCDTMVPQSAGRGGGSCRTP